MPRGQESDSHRVMLEAFEFRLRKLFPESRITLGKVIQPTWLKPDIYIEHKGGRKWVYEMIYGNANAQHILENHQRYRDAGIHDFWILWNSLAPGTKPLPSDQGVLEEFVVSRKQTKATKLLQALASIHAENMTGDSVLYSFALDALNGHLENVHPAMQAISTGITIYQIKNFAPKDQYFEYVSDYVSLMELDFDEKGFINLSRENSADENFQEHLLEALGFEDQAKHFPLNFLSDLNQMLFNLPASMPQKGVKVFVEKILADATTQDILELQDFMQSGGITKLKALMQPQIPIADSATLLENREGIQAIAQFLSNLQQIMGRTDIPILLRKFFASLFDPRQLNELADVMNWQEKSEAVKRIQIKQ